MLRPSRTERSPFPVAWYIDSVFARGMDINIPLGLRWADVNGAEVSISIDDARQIADNYFKTIHDWLPIVSMVRVFRLLNVSTTLAAADLVALFAAMHLVSQGIEREHQAETQATMYNSLKCALSACEQHGQLTTNFLAASVLKTVYEIEHGIYPAAYFSIGACSRACFTMGLHDTRWATQLTIVDTWTEKEERRRLWWTTLILDRYMNIGFTFRPLATPMIRANEIIPANDKDWDKGELAVNPLLVMSIEAKSEVAPFARACQAAHLLGRVNQHCNEHPEPSDADFHFQEAHQIQRALCALLAMLQQEYTEYDPDHRHKLFFAISLCCSALLQLYDVHSCIESVSTDTIGQSKGVRLELQQLAIDGFKHISATILDLSEEVRRAVEVQGSDCISPFVLNAFYQAAATFAWYARENGSEAHLASLNQIRDVLKLLEPRWQVAGDYLILLKDTEFKYLGGCTQ